MAKTYINGITCKSKTSQYGEFFNISIKHSEMAQYTNEKGYINMTMNKRKEPGQYGETHYFTLNEWKKENTNDSNTGDISIEDIPF